MLNLHLTRANDYEGVYLQLPSTPAEIGEAWCRLDEISSDVSSTRIVGVFSDVSNIGRYLKNVDMNAPGQMKKLNRLAEITNMLDSDGYRLFAGALDAESVNGLDDVIAIGERLDQYLYIQHVTSDTELGIFLVSYGIKPFDESVQPYMKRRRGSLSAPPSSMRGSLAYIYNHADENWQVRLTIDEHVDEGTIQVDGLDFV